jgi:hypothetical protein
LFSDRWEKKFVYVYISILNQPVHALTPFCSILNQEAVNINFWLDWVEAGTHVITHLKPAH